MFIGVITTLLEEAFQDELNTHPLNGCVLYTSARRSSANRRCTCNRLCISRIVD